jgi:hypothetical protein
MHENYYTDCITKTSFFFFFNSLQPNWLAIDAKNVGDWGQSLLKKSTSSTIYNNVSTREYRSF